MSDGNIGAPKVWVDDKKGLRKESISFKFESVVKANDLSKCGVILSQVEGLTDEYETDLLRKGGNNEEFIIQLGHSCTPIDCYIEVFLKQMLTGEESRCFIKTRSEGVISFVLLLVRIEFGGYYYSKPLQEIVRIAQLYKENGVKMFKKHPLHAHDYFNRAAKLLISCLPFETLKDRELGGESADPAQLQRLLENIQVNIAACLIKQQRYDEALYITEFAKRMDDVPEKAIYRRAVACYHLGLLDEAKTTLERINFGDNKELDSLHSSIVERLQKANEDYTKIVKRMFN